MCDSWTGTSHPYDTYTMPSGWCHPCSRFCQWIIDQLGNEVGLAAGIGSIVTADIPHGEHWLTEVTSRQMDLQGHNPDRCRHIVSPQTQKKGCGASSATGVWVVDEKEMMKWCHPRWQTQIHHPSQGHWKLCPCYSHACSTKTYTQCIINIFGDTLQCMDERYWNFQMCSVLITHLLEISILFFNISLRWCPKLSC